MPIVTDAGFAADEWTVLTAEDIAATAADADADADASSATDRARAIAPFAQYVESGGGFAGAAVANDVDIDALAPWLSSLEMIRVDFPSFADGRGFTLARRLRAAGYRGRLRAAGHVISDQYGFARSCGFDEVEISDALAARQDAAQWRDAYAGHGLLQGQRARADARRDSAPA